MFHKLQIELTTVLSITGATSSYLAFTTEVCQLLGAVIAITAGVYAIKVSRLKLKREKKKSAFYEEN